MGVLSIRLVLCCDDFCVILGFLLFCEVPHDEVIIHCVTMSLSANKRYHLPYMLLIY